MINHEGHEEARRLYFYPSSASWWKKS